MSDIEREAFEKWLLGEQGLTAEWDESRNCYKEFQAHIAWKAWQAAHQAPASGEVEPVEGEPLPCPFCGNKPDFMPHPDPTYSQVQCRNIECPIGIVGDEVSLESWNERSYTHPPAKVPEGWKLVPVEPTDEMSRAGVKVLLKTNAWATGGV